MATELFELKVIVEADGWHDLADLMTTVERALDPHRRTADGGRRWSVVAARLPATEAEDLRWFIDHWDGSTVAEPGEARMTA